MSQNLTLLYKPENPQQALKPAVDFLILSFTQICTSVPFSLDDYYISY